MFFDKLAGTSYSTSFPKKYFSHHKIHQRIYKTSRSNHQSPSLAYLMRVIGERGIELDELNQSTAVSLYLVRVIGERGIELDELVDGLVAD